MTDLINLDQEVDDSGHCKNCGDFRETVVAVMGRPFCDNDCASAFYANHDPDTDDDFDPNPGYNPMK